MSEEFEEVHASMQKLIYFILKKHRIYANHAHYVQTANIALWQAWKNFDPTKGKFETYAYVTIRGAILNDLSRTNLIEERFVSTEDSLLLLHADPYETSINSDSLFERIKPFVTDEEFFILYAYYVEQYSHKEIATFFQQSPGTLQKRKSRILSRLRRDLT